MSAPDDPFRKLSNEEPAAGSASVGPPPGSPPAPGSGQPPGYGPPPGDQPPPGYGPPTGYQQTQQNYGPQGYGPQGLQPGPQGYGPGGQETAGRAIVVLVCAIASFVIFPFIPAVVALALAGGAKDEIARSGGRLTGDGLVRAGQIVAWINIGLSVLAVVGFIVLVLVLAANGTTSTY